MSQKLSVYGFKWVEKDFIKNSSEDGDEEFFIEVDDQYSKIYHFYLKE